LENILDITNLSKRYDNFLLNNISINLPKGYIMGFIGPNGAGKSTTIKLIMNLIHKDSGDIKVFGLDNIKNEMEIKNRIGFVYDENHFYEELTVDEIVKFISPYYRNWDNSLFNRYIHRFKLPKKSKIKTLSKGMKMKLSLAIALSHNAELLILDEPTSGLDPLVRSELLEILGDIIQDENKAVFFSTHITSDLDKVADYITFINEGNIVLQDTKENIFDNYCLIKGDKQFLNNELNNLLVGVKENKYGFEGLIKNEDLVHTEAIEKLKIERPSLEDIMLFTVRGTVNV